MGLRLKNQEYGNCFFVTTSFKNHHPLGNIKGVYEALAEALNYRVLKTKSKLIAYLFMPSHIHLLLIINGKTLSNFMRDFKKYTAQKSLSGLCSTRSVWQSRYDRQAIWNYDLLETKLEYIHNNPVKAGLVNMPDKWYYSSAGDYIGRTDNPVMVWKDWY